MIGLILALLVAQPGGGQAAIDAAQSGDTIKLEVGEHGPLEIEGRHWSPRVTINAGGAKLTLRVKDSSGWLWRGGQFGPANGPGTAGYAAQVVRSRKGEFLQGVFVDSSRGIVIGQSQDIKVRYARFRGMTIDGVNIALSQRIEISNSLFEKFRTGEHHPDAIQMWSRPHGITADVKILRNRIIGPGAQGVTAFNHVRDGVDDGGFDRVSIIGNYVETNYSQGVAAYDCRVCVVSDNVVRTIPGSAHRAMINIRGGSVLAERNDVGAR